MRLTRSKQEIIIASLCLAIGAIFLFGIFIDPFSSKNVLFFLCGYAGMLVPPLALAIGIVRLFGRTGRRVNRILAYSASSVVLLAMCLSSIELLVYPIENTGSLDTVAGGLLGNLPYLCFRLFASIPLAIAFQVGLTAWVIALATAHQVKVAVDSFSKRIDIMRS